VNAFYIDRALFDAPDRPDGFEDIEIEEWRPRKGSAVFVLRGDPLPTVDFVVGGSVSLGRVSADGRELSLALATGGEVVTVLPVSPYQVAVMTSTIVARIPRTIFKALRARNPPFSDRIDRTLQKRAALLEDRAEIAHGPIVARIAQALLELAAYYGGTGLPSGEIPRTTHAVIAAFAGSTRETASVALGTLVKVGAIAVGKEWMRLDLDYLAEQTTRRRNKAVE